MRPTDTLAVTHWEDTDLVVLARVRGADAANITQSTVSSIAYKVYDTESGDQISTTGSLTVASVVYNSLQTGSEWTKDATGYNFKGTIPAVYFPEGGVGCRVEIVFTPTTGSSFPLVLDVTVNKLYGS